MSLPVVKVESESRRRILKDELFSSASFGNEAQLEALLRAKANPNARDVEGLSPLIWAARRGHSGILKILLDYKANVSASDSSRRTALHAAVLSMNEIAPILKILLDHGADPMCRDGEGRTALISASRRGRYKCIKILLSAKTDVNVGDKDGRTALIWAARNGRARCVRALLAANPKLNCTDKGGKTPLLSAAYHGKRKSLALLISAGACLDKVDSMGRSALVGAASQGHTHCVQQLVLARADANVTDSTGKTALHYALSKGYPDISSLLDSAGYDAPDQFNLNPMVRTSRSHSDGDAKAATKVNPFALLLACHQGNLKAVQSLLRLNKLHPQLFVKKDECQITGLHMACSHGHAHIVSALLDAGFSPTVRDTAGLTALHLAVKAGSAETVRVLLKQRKANEPPINCDLKTKIGSTPLHFAAQQGWTAVSAALIEARADINAGNKYGWQAIHYAASSGSSEVLRMLLEKKADPEATTRARGPGDTPLICAARHSRAQCLEILLKAKVDVSRQNRDGNTALVHAAFCGAHLCLELLIAHRADLNVRDADGSSALMQAVLCGKAKAARLLVASKADLNIVDKERNTALIYAAQQRSFSDNSAIIIMLVAAGCNANIINTSGRKAYEYGSVMQTRAAIDSGLRLRERAKKILPLISQQLGDILQDFGLVTPLDEIVVLYWNTYFHYHMGIENGQRIQMVSSES